MGYGWFSQSVSVFRFLLRIHSSLGVGVLVEVGLLKNSFRDWRMLSRDLFSRRLSRIKSGSGGTSAIIVLAFGDQLSDILRSTTLMGFVPTRDNFSEASPSVSGVLV